MLLLALLGLQVSCLSLLLPPPHLSPSYTNLGYTTFISVAHPGQCITKDARQTPDAKREQRFIAQKKQPQCITKDARQTTDAKREQSFIVQKKAATLHHKECQANIGRVA
eukprot:1145822-Pelagomonas_calceolata.AAC.2